MAQLDPVVLDALNKQITNERQNSAVYMAMACKFAVLNLAGFATFARASGTVGLSHAQRIIDYVVDRHGEPKIDALMSVEAPTCTMIDAGKILFMGALQREQITTEQIKTLYDMAEEADDPQTCQFLLYFLKAQTESESEFAELAARAAFAEGCPSAVLMLDHELGEGET